MGRATQGVRLINIKGNDSIAAVAKVMKDDEAVEEVDIMDIEVKSEDGTAIDNDSPEGANDGPEATNDSPDETKE